jgi:hypothetical protein
MMLEFTVGINIAGKHESVTVAAEDALIAALKVKCERPDAWSTTCGGATGTAICVIPTDRSPPRPSDRAPLIG